MLLGIKSILLFWLVLATGISYNELPVVQSSLAEKSLGRTMTMSVEQRVIVRSVELLAREERSLPSGVKPQLNRDIGFATVFLRLENPHRETFSFTVQKIEIRNASDQRVQAFSHPPKEIVLKPLENGEFAFYLTNKTGYVGRDQVEAVITYRVGNQTHFVVSRPVVVNRSD
jgi:hypothetical protein